MSEARITSEAPYVAEPMLDQFFTPAGYSVKKIFRITTRELRLFFEKGNLVVPKNKGESKMALNVLKECGYAAGLCQLLVSDKETGIIGDKKDLDRRKRVFGKNKIALPTITPFLDLLAAQYEDTNVIVLIFAATFYLLFALFSTQETAYMETLTIYCGVFFASLIAGTADWIKERQYLKIKDEINNAHAIVFRGQYGSTISVPIRDLVVGDVIDIQQGDRVPADCVLVDETNITVDESMYNAKDTAVEKSESFTHGDEYEREYDNHKEHPDPFLLSGSMIMTGSGRAIVCAVGKETRLAITRKPQDLMIKEQQTFLEEKLEALSQTLTKYAIIIALLIIATQLVFLVAMILFDSSLNLMSNETVLRAVKLAILAVCMLIVAIPEGLPLAVSIAMALSVSKLKHDQILIKNLDAVQTCAMLHDICVGKTGTITKGILNVMKMQFCSDPTVHENDGALFFADELEVQAELKEIIKEAIISNTDVRIEANDAEAIPVYEPCGQELEVALIRFLMENNEDVHNAFINRNRNATKIVQLPFDQALKRKVVVRRVQGDPTQVRVYVKGAPEYIVPLCTETFDYQMQQIGFDEDDHYKVLSTVVSESMACNGFKTLSYAYKQMPEDELNSMMQHYHIESDEFREDIQSGLIYLGTFGLEDPVREDVDKSIQLIKYGTLLGEKVDRKKGAKNQVNIRMITGDHMQTALHVALQVGIITEEEQEIKGIYMTGDQFREAIGHYEREWDEATQRYNIVFADTNAFNKVKSRLRIIARATAEDKFILVAGIKQAGGLVGMTGDSIADAMALKRADVGLCMGSGCQVAKDQSDLVILDNDFVSIHSAIKWGRAIFDNVRKFLQFQMTVNISLCLIVLIAGATLGKTPLNVIQLLWTNLIMDILAAIAIGTEPYMQDVVLKEGDEQNKKATRISRREAIILPEMWRNIFGAVVYQLLVLLVLVYFGEFIFFPKPFNIIYEELRDENGQPTDRLVMDTIIFHTFILMNLFNQINCRVVEADEFNVFKTLFNNPTFWAVMIFELAVQNWMLWLAESELGSVLVGTAPLSSSQTIACWCLGAGSLIVYPLAKLIPLEKLKPITKHLDLEKDPNANPLLQALHKGEKHLQRRKSQVLNYSSKDADGISNSYSMVAGLKGGGYRNSLLELDDYNRDDFQRDTRINNDDDEEDI